MSKIKLPHASGNSMSIAAPATNPSGDLELKLPATIGSADYVLKNSGTAGTLELSSSINTPIVFAYSPAITSPTLSDATWTKNTWLTSEDVDTDSAWDTSNQKFTVPAGKGGTYFVAISNSLYSSNSTIRAGRVRIYKNGSHQVGGYQLILTTGSSNIAHFTPSVQTVISLSAGDYLESYMLVDVESGTAYYSSDGQGLRTNYFICYRISA